MAPSLLLVPSTFLTTSGLSNFCNLNPCLAIHKHLRCTTVQERFYHYAFMHIYLLYSNIQPHFPQHFEGSPDLLLTTPLSCCAFPLYGCTAFSLFCCAFWFSWPCAASLHLCLSGPRCFLFPCCTSRVSCLCAALLLSSSASTPTYLLPLPIGEYSLSLIIFHITSSFATSWAS